MTEAHTPPPTAAFAGPFDGRAEFQQNIRDALALASSQGWAEMWWSDYDFNDWPLGERVVIESLQAWARSGRRLVMLAGRFEDIRLRHPRLVQWRGMWDHIIECRTCKGKEPGEFPCVLWSPGWVLHRRDAERFRGVCSTEPGRRLLLKETLNECKRQSAPGFPATVLGL